MQPFTRLTDENQLVYQVHKDPYKDQNALEIL